MYVRQTVYTVRKLTYISQNFQPDFRLNFTYGDFDAIKHSVSRGAFTTSKAMTLVTIFFYRKSSLMRFLRRIYKSKFLVTLTERKNVVPRRLLFLSHRRCQTCANSSCSGFPKLQLLILCCLAQTELKTFRKYSNF